MARLDSALAWWTQTACRRARWVVLVLLPVSGFLGHYAVTHLSVDSDTGSMLSDDLAWRQEFRAYERAFPELGEACLGSKRVGAQAPKRGPMAPLVEDFAPVGADEVEGASLARESQAHRASRLFGWRPEEARPTEQAEVDVEDVAAVEVDESVLALGVGPDDGPPVKTRRTLDESAATDVTRQAGAAIARFHSTRQPRFRARPHELVPCRLAALARDLGVLAPDLEGPARDLARRLGD